MISYLKCDNKWVIMGLVNKIYHRSPKLFPRYDRCADEFHRKLISIPIKYQNLYHDQKLIRTTSVLINSLEDTIHLPKYLIISYVIAI